MARKRPIPSGQSSRPAKRPRTDRLSDAKDIQVTTTSQSTYHAVLSRYYRKVLTLRSFLLANLPTSSRIRRRRLLFFGRDQESCLLDTCLVGVLDELSPSIKQARKAEYACFTQTQHATGAFSGKSSRASMVEIIDFVIWSLFKGQVSRNQRPQHILCHGLTKIAAHISLPKTSNENTFPHGIARQHPNDNIQALKSQPWTEIVPLLGKDADTILASLLLDCGIFIQLSTGGDNYFQLSGAPLASLAPVDLTSSVTTLISKSKSKLQNRPAKIRFIRSRILYAKPAFNQVGNVRFGLKHEHALERFSDATRREHTTRIMKYIFPRQFRLHNVFTSTVDPSETAQQLKDYTFRELDMSLSEQKSNKVPRRLRSGALDLVHKIQRNHNTCAYSQRLRHFCPIFPRSHLDMPSTNEAGIPQPSSAGFITQNMTSSSHCNASNGSPGDGGEAELSFLPYSTPPGSVSAFCRSVIAHLLPTNAFGIGQQGTRNRFMVMRNIDRFVQMRRFETLSLHEVMQSIQLSCITWLQPPDEVGDSSRSRMCKSDYTKRVELLQEFIYYVFDSLLIPLIRSNFYVTESSSHRNRLFYFRHDVWRKLSEPSLTMLRLSMYVTMEPRHVRHALKSQALGYSHLRLLPKDAGARPITNLRRRQSKQVSGRRVLGPSINAQLAPLFSVLKYERSQHMAAFGSALFSVGDLHSKLVDFKSRLPSGSRILFAKVDIKSCFDSIPQKRLLELVELIFDQSGYRTTKHAEFKAGEGEAGMKKAQGKRRFITSARPADEEAVLSEAAATALAVKKRQIVYTDTGNQRIWPRNNLLRLLQSHVQESIVKVGKKHMMQKDGIPQGSVLSSMLCSYFYGRFETSQLGFLNPESCLLLRLIDDFLLLTTDHNAARRFLEVMANESNEYGIQVNAEKSLANFEVTIKGCKVPRTHGTNSFPYCGMAIDMKTLELSKDRTKKDAYISNALTVDACSTPGIVLKRKVLSSLKLQMHSMLLDMSLNSKEQVTSTLLANFTESAMKFHQYMVQLGQKRRPSTHFIKQLIEELISAASKICSVKSDQEHHMRWSEMCWIGAIAFEQVLSRKQSQYTEILRWLDTLRKDCEARLAIKKTTKESLLRRNLKIFAGYVY